MFKKNNIFFGLIVIFVLFTLAFFIINQNSQTSFLNSDSNRLSSDSNSDKIKLANQIILPENSRKGENSWLTILTEKEVKRIKVELTFIHPDDSKYNYTQLIDDFERVSVNEWRTNIKPPYVGPIHVKAYLRFLDDSLKEIFLDSEISEVVPWNILFSPILIDGYDQDSLNSGRVYDVGVQITNNSNEFFEGIPELRVLDTNGNVKQIITENKINLAPNENKIVIASLDPSFSGPATLEFVIRAYSDTSSIKKNVLIIDSANPGIVEYVFDEQVTNGLAFHSTIIVLDDSDVNVFLSTKSPSGKTAIYYFEKTERSFYHPDYSGEHSLEFIPAGLGKHEIIFSACDNQKNCNSGLIKNFDVIPPAHCQKKKIFLSVNGGKYYPKEKFDFLNQNYCVTIWNSNLPPSITYLESFDTAVLLSGKNSSSQIGFLGLEIPSTIKTSLVIEGPIFYYNFYENKEFMKDVLKIGQSFIDFNVNGTIPSIDVKRSHPIFVDIESLPGSYGTYTNIPPLIEIYPPAVEIASWNYVENSPAMVELITMGEKRLFINMDLDYVDSSIRNKLLDNIIKWAVDDNS